MASKFNTAFLLIFLTIIAFLVLYPLVYVVSAAFSPGTSIASLSIMPFSDGFTLEHFQFLFFESNYPIWFRNTLIIAISTSAGTVAISAIAAYTFSRFHFAFKKAMLLTMLILQIFPSIVGMIAIYVILLRMGALDTLWGLILVYLAMNIPFNCWLVKSYIDTIPKSIDEAARIDGANHLRIFFTIILPIAKPIITFLAITSFVGPWMDFIFPNLVLRSPSTQTLALGLFTFILDDTRNEFTRFAAGSVIVAIPFILAFISTEKLLVKSLGGAVKE